jgi:hypothetical protein
MRRLVIVAILLAGCSEAAKSTKSSKSANSGSSFRSTWKPEADPQPKPPPPPPAPPPPPDPVAEKRRAEIAQREAEARERREKEREFADLPSLARRQIVFVGDALKTKGLDRLANADLMVVKRYPRQFPSVTPVALDQALAAYGDHKGALDHLTKLGISDPETMLRVRAAFGYSSDPTCEDARRAATEIAKVGLDGISDRAKTVVAGHPELFPIGPPRR